MRLEKIKTSHVLNGLDGSNALSYVDIKTFDDAHIWGILQRSQVYKVQGVFIPKMAFKFMFDPLGTIEIQLLSSDELFKLGLFGGVRT